MNFKKISVALLASVSLFFASCSNDDDSSSAPLGDYDNGLFVVNEGSFGNTSGTISFIPYDLSEVKKNVFKTVNGEDLGSLAQSMITNKSRAYIVVNDSHVIQVVNRYTFEKEATIDQGLDNPRFMTVFGTKAYVTNWGDTADETDDYIAVLDLNSNTVTEKIPVELGPEKIFNVDDKVFVLHQGAWGQNNKVSVINTNDDSVTKVITVGDIPSSGALDIQGNLWVLGAGKAAWTGSESAGSITKINTATLEIEKTINFETSEHPGLLNFYNNTFYYVLNGSLYSFDSSIETIPTEAKLSELNAYGLKVGKDKVFVTDAKDYISYGEVKVYDLNSFTEEKSLEVGIIPNAVVFNQID
ncbi:DUF5074 domain-containing protein [Aureivirga marina]|uniref:DUF5074 domain-containing protein n=1 Tax=Aureivirga marina TaxID=1182451 RepID=UPI0018CAAC99|nr:DUF5074 domain-containing protein [Aureivirga marina]